MVLSGIQVDVVSDVADPDHVLETYTFTIAYKSTDGQDRLLSGLSLGSSVDQHSGVDNIHEGLLPFLDELDQKILSAKSTALPGT